MLFGRLLPGASDRGKTETVSAAFDTPDLLSRDVNAWAVLIFSLPLRFDNDPRSA